MKILGPRSPAIAPAAAPGHDDNSHFEFSRDLEAFKRKRNIYIYLSESGQTIFKHIQTFYIYIYSTGLRNTSPAEDCLLPQRHPPRLVSRVFFLWSKLVLAGSSTDHWYSISLVNLNPWDYWFRWFSGLQGERRDHHGPLRGIVVFGRNALQHGRL